MTVPTVKSVFGWALILLIWGGSLEFSHAQSLDGIRANKVGVAALKKEEPLKAFRAFSEAVNLDPGVINYRLNLALVIGLNQEYEKAEKEYQLAIEMAKDHPELRFAGWFNLGVMRTEKSDIPGALAAYQNALDINPASQEVKTNIELLWKQQQKQSGGKGQQKKKSSDQPSENSEGGDEEQDQNQDPGGDKNEEPKQGEEKKPKSFEELNPEMARKILEELKAQEQRVRAEHLGQGAKEKPRDKQW